MAINWGAAGANNNALAYFQMGQQIGQSLVDAKVNKALGRVLTGGQTSPQGAPTGAPAPAPGMPGMPQPMPGGMTPGIGDQHNRDMGRNTAADDLALIARHNPTLAMQLQQRQRQMMKDQQEAQRTKLVETAKLFDGVTPENYGQRLALAQQLGIDTSGAPQAFDPAWVQQNQQIMRFAVDKPEQLSGIARELVDAGYQPNTPEFKQAMAGVINNKYAAEYVNERGDTVRRSTLNLRGPGGQSAPKIISQKPAGLTDDQIWAQAHEAVRNGANVEEVFRQLQAWGMKP